MKDIAKAITSLGILWFMYKVLSIDWTVAMILGWIVIPIGLFVIYGMFKGE